MKSWTRFLLGLVLLAGLAGCNCGSGQQKASPSAQLERLAGSAVTAAAAREAKDSAGVASSLVGRTADSLPLTLADFLSAQVAEDVPRRSYFDGWYVGLRTGVYLSIGQTYGEEADYGFGIFMGMDLFGKRLPVNLVAELTWIDASEPLPNSLMILSAYWELEHYFGQPKEEKTRLYALLGGGWVMPVEDIENSGGHKGHATGTFIGGGGVAWPLPGPRHWKFVFDCRYYWFPGYAPCSGFVALTGGIYYVF